MDSPIHPKAESNDRSHSKIGRLSRSEVIALRFRFKSKKLEELYTSEKGANKYGPSVVEAFFDVMSIIDAMSDVRELYTLKSLHFEKLQGKRGKCGERSLRLNDQWRLIIAIEQDAEGNYILVININDYH